MKQQIEQSMTQVSATHYSHATYDTLERFISYHAQVASVLELKPQSVLEIGVGNKLVTRCLEDAGVAVTTVDFDERLRPDIVADVRQLPVGDASHDLVLACQVLEHIPFDDFDKALGELHRVSRRYVVVSLPRRGTAFELVLRFPFVRTLFKKGFLDISFYKYLDFGGFEKSGQHYFEIDRAKTTLSMVREALQGRFRILKEFSPPLDKYHYFFIMERL